jgi:hypothetical protein
MRRVLRAVGNVLATLLACVITGLGVGFTLAEIVSHAWLRSAQIAFVEGAAFLGGGAQRS